MSDEHDLARCEELTKTGYDRFNDGEYEAALTIARQLKDLSYSSGFEIEALALNGQGETEKAVDVLREGVEATPSVWLLWQLLGNYESDLERYDLAARAYARALECDPVDTENVVFNQAVLASRTGRNDDAFDLLEDVEDTKFLLARAAMRVEALIDRNDLEQADAEALSALNALAEDAELFDSRWYGRLIAQFARSCILDKEPVDEVHEFLVESIGIDPSNSQILKAIRELNAKPAGPSSYWWLLLKAEAKEPGPEKPLGYVVSCEIVATDPDAALTCYRRCSPDETEYRIIIDEFESLKAATPEWQGVYWISERTYYDSDDDSQDS